MITAETATPSLETIMKQIGKSIGYHGLELVDKSNLYCGDSKSTSFVEKFIKTLGYQPDCTIKDYYHFRNYSTKSLCIHAQVASAGMASASGDHDGQMVAVTLRPMNNQFGRQSKYKNESFAIWVYLDCIKSITQFYNILIGEDKRTSHWKNG